MKFDLPKDSSSIIKVIGVGGGGSNAVNHMFKQGIDGVDFMVCNTDQQALDISPIPLKMQLGTTLTEGRGAGSIPDVGRNAAIENLDEIKAILEKNTKMVFITAGMGGGTGTGAAPVIAQIARELGVLTVGIVTMPFFFEGKKRRQQAESGIEAIRENVDTLLIINNEKLREMGGNLPIAQAFAMADNVLTTAAKGIAEIITRTGYINVDFEDVRTVMTQSGVAIMGSATSEGDDRATKAVEKALASPLLNDNNIEGARYVLLNITFGNQEVLMDEISDITDYIQDEAGSTADVIWGYGMDESLGDKLSVTIIATGFKSNPHTGVNLEPKQEKKVMNLEEKEPAPQVKKHALNDEEPFLKAPQNTIKPAEPQQPVQPAPPAAPPQRVFEFDMHKKAEEPQQDYVQQTPNAEEPKKDEWQPFLKKETEEAQPAAKASATEQPKEEQPAAPAASTQNPARQDQLRQANDRLMRLRELSMKLRTPSGLTDLENEPAFKRKSVNLDDVPHSSESSVSRFTLSEREDEGGEKKATLRQNNSFLHDNVD